MSAPAVTATAPQRMTPRTIGLLLVVCGAIFLEGIDIAMLNVAVPAIAADIGLTTGSAHWVISAYILGYAGFLLLGGRSADLFGRRRVFLIAMAVFLVFSGLGGLATASWVLIMARFVTGIAAGFLAPAGFSIVTTTFTEGPLRSRALAIYGAVGAGGYVLGTVFGGLLSTAGWRLVFFAPMVVIAVLLVAAVLLIRPDPPRQPAVRRSFDVGGALTITGGMVAAVYALVSFGEDRDVWSGLTALAVAAILIIAFVQIERRGAAPLIRLDLLRTGALPMTAVAGLLFMAAFFSFQFAITLYLQDFRGWTPLENGMTFAIMGADVILAPVFAPRLVQRFGNAAVMTAGLISGLLAFALLLRLQADWAYIDLLPSLLLVAIAFALVYGPLTSAATDGLAESEHGTAGGVVFTAFQFGGALGLAVVTILLVGDHQAAELGDYRRALLAPVIFATLAAIVGLVLAIRAAARSAHLGEQRHLVDQQGS